MGEKAQMFVSDEPLILKLDGANHQILKPNESAVFRFRTGILPKKEPLHYRFRLFCKGEPITDSPVLSEWGGGLFMRDIDDSLSTVTHHSRFSLRFSQTDEPACRRAYYKLPTKPLRYPGDLRVEYLPDDGIYTFSFYSKAENFEPLDEAEVRAELFFCKEGRSHADIFGDADEIRRFPLRAGTYDFQKTEVSFPIGEQVACILFTVSVGASRGTVYVEDVSLHCGDRYSFLPQFRMHSGYSGSVDWFGENLSAHEWSDFEVSVNGNPVRKVSFFSSIYRLGESDFEMDAKWFSGEENEITLRYIPDYFAPVSYRLEEVSLLAWERHPFRIVSCPHTVSVGKRFYLVAECEREGETVRIGCDSHAVVPLCRKMRLDHVGLHTIGFDVTDNCGTFQIMLEGSDYSEARTVARTVQRGDDGVICATGDAIYIPQNEDKMIEFLKWYLANECGNFITFRPVYHWSGTKSLNPALWKRIVPSLNRMEMQYCLLFDERELSGLNANPTRSLMEGPCFIGFQGHEVDGMYYYWGNENRWGINGVFYRELRSRILNHPDISYRSCVHYHGNRGYFQFDPSSVRSMEDGARIFERNLCNDLKGIVKHTGVTLEFRHIIRAGVEIPGAEIMYGNHEILLSGLRGSAYCYGKPTTASHLALQWHSHPLGYPGFYERFMLSLNLSYLHGVSQINTEEGLWRMEAANESHHRFSAACRENQRIQRRFLRFLQCHTRRGTPAHLHGIIYGNCESYNGYSDSPAWDLNRPGWEFGAPSDLAWEQIKVFYPQATIIRPAWERRGYAMNPIGWYSSTPYGLCEILPVETAPEKLAPYPYLAFMGYHLATEELTFHLIDYVFKGGTLLLCLCHLSAEADRSASRSPSFATELISGYERLTGFSVQEIRYDGYRRAVPSLCGAEVRLRHNGEPLVLEHQIGKGRVITINSFEFPSHEVIRNVYHEELKKLAEQSCCQRAIRVDIREQAVEYAFYDCADGTETVYFANVAWNAPDIVPKVCISTDHISAILPVPFGALGILRRFGDFMTYTCDQTTEVLSVERQENGVTVTVQGEEYADFCLLSEVLFESDGKETIFREGNLLRIRFPLNGLTTLCLKEKRK